MEDHLDNLWQLVSAQPHARQSFVHGPAHWRRVERNGLLLATRTGADPLIVQLFAIFHDSRRENDDWDPEHGARGAEYAAQLRGFEYKVSDEQFTLLKFACRWHADEMLHDDPTVGTCWDADRLDLGRVGIIPNSQYMSTEFGREIVEAGSIQAYL